MDNTQRAVCARCGVVHTQKPFNLGEAVKAGALVLRDQIEADLLKGIAAKRPEEQWTKTP